MCSATSLIVATIVTRKAKVKHMNKDQNTPAEQTAFIFTMEPEVEKTYNGYQAKANKGATTPQKAALDAITAVFASTATLRASMTKREESLSAVIERVLPDIVGKTHNIKRAKIKQHLIDQNTWDEKYIKECLSRTFSKLFPAKKQSNGGRKAPAEVIKEADQIITDKDAKTPEQLRKLAKHYRAIATRLTALAEEQETALKANTAEQAETAAAA